VRAVENTSLPEQHFLLKLKEKRGDMPFVLIDVETAREQEH
jgi:hypothetical protein